MYYRFTRGRINRATYWLLLAILIAAIVAFVMVTGTPAPFGLILMIVLCAPRLHDVGRTGWWVAVPIILYSILAIGGSDMMGEENASMAKGAVALVVLLELVLLGVWRSRPGPNPFGPQPPPGISFERFREEKGQQA